MLITYFNSVKESKDGHILDASTFWQITQDPRLLNIVKAIREALDNSTPETEKAVKSKIAALKKQLPVVCWQASFKDSCRKDASAVPSGLFMLDIDHTTKETMLAMILKAKCMVADKGIVYIGETPKYGVRIVAKCYADCSSIAECQAKLFDALDVPDNERDTSCIDWARCSFMMPEKLIHFIDANTIFFKDAEVVYENRIGEQNVRRESTKTATAEKKEIKHTNDTQTEYKGIPLKQIGEEWLRRNGGIPEEGNRNTQLFKLAIRLRYICDFNPNVLLNNIDSYGLDETEMRAIIHSAINFARQAKIPQDLLSVINLLHLQSKLAPQEKSEEITDINDTTRIPALPPIFKEWYDAAPDDFKVPSIIIQLPILGALGSRLRAEYLDGNLHSPSFQVSLEAPQASGKSFMRKIIDYDLELMKEHDEIEREKEREYKEKVQQLKLTNTKLSAKDKEELLGDKPYPLIRYCPATMSITQLLIRMNNAKGLHLFAMAEEIDTVYKAFKRGFSSFSDALRCSFDNAEYGQDYASDTSFSGIVKLYYNVLYSGTPKAMRRFYPDVEDGLVSRVFFCTLPDQFGKPHPHWTPFTEEQQHDIQLGLVRLNEITLQNEDVQPAHILQLDWLAKDMENWVIAQQKEAVITNDRTRDTFCRRAAVVGFRAGMLAWFLWGETPTRKKSVKSFSRWIANLMLKQHLTRFNIVADTKNTLPYPDVFEVMKDDFSANDVSKALASLGLASPARQVIYKWMAAGLIRKAKGNKFCYNKVK